ncbi:MULTISPECIES: hypothetical protein [unclassified Jeotgalibaca]|uniref:hypothetical protein n=1 Tax=unclassified Jeotgalibaca TaxID=2621505 RepID=UPI003FD33EE3
MDKADILLTNLTIKGNFYDISLYSGFLYLWKDRSNVSIYHWRKWIEHLGLQDLPIYQEPIVNQSLFLDEADLQPFLFKALHFDRPIRGNYIYRHRLYFIDETGFYVRYPEKANTSETLLMKGDFHSLDISSSNRIILVSETDGIFEWHMETIIPWDDTPTASIVLRGNDILQLDENDEPIQLMVFGMKKREPYLIEKIAKNKLQINTTYYKTSLNFDSDAEAVQAISLFHFLPDVDRTTTQIIGDPIKIRMIPHPNLASETLDDQYLSLSENSKGLTMRLGNDTYFSYDEYLSYRLYPKSLDYQNHLHLISDEQISLFMFNKLL